MTKGRNPWQQKQFEKKKILKIQTLRKYAKILKRENIEDSQRLRFSKTNIANHSIEIEKEDFDANEIVNQAPNSNNNYPIQKKSKRPTPADELSLKEKKEFERQEREQQRLKGIEEANRKRKTERKMLSLKTKKGQPVLKGHINKILGKLLKEQS